MFRETKGPRALIEKSCCLIYSYLSCPWQNYGNQRARIWLYLGKNPLPLNIRVMMIVRMPRLHSKAGNYALPLPNPSTALVEFPLSTYPKQLCHISGLLFNICLAHNAHFKRSSNWILFHHFLLEEMPHVSCARVLLCFGSQGTFQLIELAEFLAWKKSTQRFLEENDTFYWSRWLAG